MKTSKNSKLSLRTETIMVLTPHELAGAHGGILATTVTSSNPCIAAGIAAGRSSDKCAQKAGESLAKGNDYAKQHLGFSF